MNPLIDDNKGLRSKLNSRVATAIVIVLIIPRFLYHCFIKSGYLLDSWPACQLCINYSYGFVKRAFLGSITSLLSSLANISYERSVISMMLIEEVVFTASILAFLILVINRFKDANLNLLIILFVSLNIIGFYGDYWGESDIVLMTLTLAMCVLIVKRKLLILVPVLAAVCVLIHEGYVMMYFGVVVSLLLYAIGNNYKDSKTVYSCVLVATVISAALLFVYMYFYSAGSINISSDYLDNYLSETFGFSGSSLYDAINYTYFGKGLPHAAMWVDGKPTEEFYVRIIAVITNSLVLSPLIFYKMSLYRGLIKEAVGMKSKLLWIMCLSLSVLTLPLIIVQTDEGRWFYDIVFFEFMVVVFLYVMDQEKIKPQLQKILKCNYLNIALCVVYFIMYAEIDLEYIMLYQGYLGLV